MIFQVNDEIPDTLDTPLGLAAQNGFTDVCELLLDHGEDQQCSSLPCLYCMMSVNCIPI